MEVSVSLHIPVYSLPHLKKWNNNLLHPTPNCQKGKTQVSFLWRIHFQGLFLLLTHSSFFSGKLRKNRVDLFGSIPNFLVGHVDCGIKVPRAFSGQLPPRETVPKLRLPVAQEHIRLILESVHGPFGGTLIDTLSTQLQSLMKVIFYFPYAYLFTFFLTVSIIWTEKRCAIYWAPREISAK